jgi:hypothetical protein
VSLVDLIASPETGIQDIARYLDGLDGASRWKEVGALDRDLQRSLYEKAAQSPPLDLEYFVAGAGPLVEVIHDGLNTLPLPSPVRRFQKRFCRPAGTDGVRLFGYNEGPTRRLVGPGFFVTIPTKGRPAWESRGPVVVDYFQVPDSQVAPGWPTVATSRR